MLQVIVISCLFILPFALLVLASVLRHRYRILKEQQEETPGSVMESELRMWKWISRCAGLVFCVIMVILISFPVLFVMALRFM